MNGDEHGIATRFSSDGRIVKQWRCIDGRVAEAKTSPPWWNQGFATNYAGALLSQTEMIVALLLSICFFVFFLKAAFWRREAARL